MQKMQEVGEAETLEFLLSGEVMDLLRISRRTLDRWTANGRLPSSQPGGPKGVRLYPKEPIETLASAVAVVRGEVAS